MTSFDLNCSIYSQPEFPPSPRRWTAWKISAEKIKYSYLFHQFWKFFYSLCFFIVDTFFSPYDDKIEMMRSLFKTFSNFPVHFSAKACKRIFQSLTSRDSAIFEFIAFLSFLQSISKSYTQLFDFTSKTEQKHGNE